MPRYAALLFPLVAINLALADPRQAVNLDRRAIAQHAKDNGNINSGNGNGASVTGLGNNGGAGTNPTLITSALTSTITTFTVVGNGVTETELIFATTDANNKVSTITSTLAANGIGAGAGSAIKDQVPGAVAASGNTDAGSQDTAGQGTSDQGTAGQGTSGTDTSGTDTSGTDTSGTDTSGTDTSGAGDTVNATCNDAAGAMPMATTITQCDAMPTGTYANKGKENFRIFPVRPGHRELIGFYEENKGKDVYYVKVLIETMAKGDSKAKGFTTYIKGHDGQPKVTGAGQYGNKNVQQNGQQNNQNGKKEQGNQGH